MPVDIIEMFWGCTTCKAENKGRFKTCQGCGKPRTEDCPEWLPGDISPMAAVKDAKLLHKFKGGADWKCKYCGSSQFRVDGNCAQCGSEQGDSKGKKSLKDKAVRGELTKDDIEQMLKRPEPKVEANPFPAESFEEPRGYREAPRRVASATTPPPTAVDLDEDEIPKIPRFQIRLPSPKLLGVGAAVLAVGLILYLVFRTKVVDASVSAVSWDRTVAVERYKVWSREGWDPDFGAFDIRDEGRRIHHYEHVRVGSHTEQYTERVACGQDCTTTPRSCRTTPRSCTSNKNGSATCSGGDTVCTGGDRVCTIKYCNVSRTRTVDDYEDQPRYRDWHSWRVWDWGPQRVVRVGGATTNTFWPAEEQIALNVGLLPGEKEREGGRTEKYEVRFVGDGETYTLNPKNDVEFKSFTLGRKYRLKVGVAHGVEVLPSR